MSRCSFSFSPPSRLFFSRTFLLFEENGINARDLEPDVDKRNLDEQNEKFIVIAGVYTSSDPRDVDDWQRRQQRDYDGFVQKLHRVGFDEANVPYQKRCNGQQKKPNHDPNQDGGFYNVVHPCRKQMRGSHG
jgi:hypothetical protein